MIDDLDRSIEVLLARELPQELGSQVAVSFAAPDDQFPPASVALPAIDVFLYDVRENRDLRSPDWPVERTISGTRKHPPLVRIDVSYLITAWASGSSTTAALDEHRLLGETIRALLRHPVLPEPILQGAMRGQRAPLPATTLTPGRLQSLGEFWQALGGKPKAAVNYTVTVAVEPWEALELGPPVVEKKIGFEQTASTR
jgi:hypothetical protein